MKQEGFQVIADIYRFLGSYDPSAIYAASKLPGISENLRSALIALHQETTIIQSASLKLTSVKKRNRGIIDVMKLLMDKDYFPTKQALEEVVKILGIKIKVSTRDSHERLARRIAFIVNENPKISNKLYDLIGVAKDTQTAGWIDLIRRSS